MESIIEFITGVLESCSNWFHGNNSPANTTVVENSADQNAKFQTNVSNNGDTSSEKRSSKSIFTLIDEFLN